MPLRLSRVKNVQCHFPGIAANSLSRSGSLNLNWQVANSSDKQTNLVNYVINGNTLEVYYVAAITDETVGINYSGGIIVKGSADISTTAHEFGHSLGLGDIYTAHGSSIHIESGAPVRESWLPEDWSAFYLENLTQANLLTRLLMFGVNDYRAGTDVSSGPVYCVRYDWVSVNGGFQKVYVLDGNGATGLNSITNRCPVHN